MIRNLIEKLINQPKRRYQVSFRYFGKTSLLVSTIILLASSTALAAQKPYFVVLGGDIAGGSIFESTQNSCYPWDGTVFASWNNDNASNNGYYGGGVQGAAYVSDVIDDFVTDLDSTQPLTKPNYDFHALGGIPNVLGFANNNVQYAGAHQYRFPINFANADYGGNFQGPCLMPQYNTAASSATPLTNVSGAFPSAGTVDVGKLPGGDYSYNGNLTVIDSVPLSQATTGGNPVTIAVNGDVYIDSNINYAYTSPLNIPQLNIYAGGTHPTYNQTDGRGNLYIDASVSVIHGNFTAEGDTQSNCPGVPAGQGAGPGYCDFQAYDFFDLGWNSPNDYTDGLFADCASEVSPGNFTSTANLGPCDTQLKIDGTVSANVYWLERSYGDLNSVQLNGNPANTNAANAAEVFQYSPESWLPTLSTPSCPGGTCISPNYTTLTSLPPTL